MAKFQIRTQPIPSDADFILGAFDSTLPHLAASGSGDQWGSEPFTQNARRVAKIRKACQQATDFERTGEGSRYVFAISELPLSADGQLPDQGKPSEEADIRSDEEGRKFLRCAAGTVKDEFSEYLVASESTKSIVEEAMSTGEHIFLEILVSDYRAGDARKGAGAGLMAWVKEYAQILEKKCVYVDCWAGNGRKLVKYYQAHGYKVLADFEAEGWPGTLLKLDLGTERS